jgi:hypothetical protein
VETNISSPHAPRTRGFLLASGREDKERRRRAETQLKPSPPRKSQAAAMACVAALLPFPSTSTSCSCRLRSAAVARAPRYQRARRELRRFDEVRRVPVSVWCTRCGADWNAIWFCCARGMLAGGRGVEEAARHWQQPRRRRLAGFVFAQGSGSRHRLQGAAGARRVGLFCFYSQVAQCVCGIVWSVCTCSSN